MTPLLLTCLLAAPPGDPLADIDAAVERALKAHKVPGLGVAVVKDGKVVWLKGYGVRTAGKPDPVTGGTLFAIGSVTKSFTAASLGILVGEGKLTWDTPLVNVVPTFRLKDPYLTQNVTVRDVLSHRVGLGRNELVWYGSRFDRGQILGKLGKLDPQAAFRTAFVYNNMLYMAAGQVVYGLTDEQSTWDEFVAEKLFRPLGMTTANTRVADLPRGGDVATPHEKADGKPTPVEWKNIDNIGPAGAINASAADMAEYVKFQLAGGKAGDDRLIPRDVFREMHTPQTLIPQGGFSLNPDALSRSYGFGWFLSDFKGKRLVEHGGNIDGMTAQVGMLPTEKLGVVVLANAGGSLLPQALMYDLFDRYLGDAKANRAETTGALATLSEFGTRAASEPDEKKRAKDTKPSLPLDKYAGAYRDDVHDTLTVTHKDGKLKATFNGWAFDLNHWHYDTFRGTTGRPGVPKVLFTFVLGADGAVAEVRSRVLVADELRLKRVGN